MTHGGIRLHVTLFLVGCMTASLFAQQGKKVAEPKSAKAESASSEASTHRVKPERLKIEVNLTGKFEPIQMWPVVLHPETWSSLTVIKAVDHGKTVEKGETLVWLDTTDIDQQLEDLEHAQRLSKLSQRVAKTQLELLKKTVPLDLAAAERAQEIANQDLNDFMKTDRPFQEESAKFSLKSSQNSLEYAEEELKQLEKMYKADDLTEETEEIILKRARNDVERSRFYLRRAELDTKETLERELPRAEQRMIDAARRADIALAKSSATLPVDLQKEEIGLEKQLLEDQRSQQKLAKLRRDRQLMDVTAPASGYVYYGKWTRGKWSGADSVASQLIEGGKLSPHNVFMTIVNPRPLRIRVDVPEKELHRLNRGLKGKATPNGFPQLELPVTLRQLSPLPVGGETFDGQFDVTLPETAKAIVPGMGCKLTLVIHDKADAITVPAKAVFENDADGQRNVVYVKREGSEPEKRNVVVGQRTEEKWEIVRGLSEGDQVLLKRPDQ